MLVGSLLLAAGSPSLGVLLVASFAIGLSATMAQDVVPAAATLAPDLHRGKVVGTVMTGLLMGILLSVGFSAFWSTLAIMLHDAPFHLGSAAAGAFGLAGAAGALAAPIAGRISDRRGPEWVTRFGIGVVAVSFAAMAFAAVLSPHAQLGLIAVSTVGFDLGIQASLIAHQTIVYGIDPASRSRLNAVLFVGVFIGMATGAALGSLLLAQWGWGGVIALAVATAVAAMAVRVWPRKG